jgi:hypothetical protein
MATWRVVFTLAAVASAQSVISTHAGLIHFFQGAVFVNDHPLEAHLGKFTNVPQGAELRTEQGRAEVLLTPGVFLRVGENSAIRMAATELADTQVELVSGSAMVEAGEPNKDTAVTITYRNWKARFPQKGLFRIDSDPPRLWALRGSAEVAASDKGDPIKVEAGMYLPLAAVLVPEQSSLTPSDALSDWARGRSQSIVADNAITAQIDEDPPEFAAGLDNFVYFPMLGLMPSLGSSYSSLYSSVTPYQPGFSSIYLPGYNYQPIFVGIPTGIRVGGGYIPRPIRIGTGTGIGIGTPRQPQQIPRPAPIRVGAPLRGGVVVGGHR